MEKIVEDKKRYIRKGKSIIFGLYPQTKETDPETISKLTAIAGTLPTSSNFFKWTSYGYYKNGNITNYMFYIDIDTNNDNVYDYRGVYFTGYRPTMCDVSPVEDDFCQKINGYYTSNVYFFKYEQVKWNILEEENAKALIISDLVLDSQQYYYDGSYNNNYEESTIRKWLNDTFYNTCFNSYEKEIIETTNVDNSVSTTGCNKLYACSNTLDKIFLLSYKEVTTYYTSDSKRKATASDYAKSQGIYEYSEYNTSNWWLRSPNDFVFYYTGALAVSDLGDAYGYHDVFYTHYGVRAACWINL